MRNVPAGVRATNDDGKKTATPKWYLKIGGECMDELSKENASRKKPYGHTQVVRQSCSLKSYKPYLSTTIAPFQPFRFHDDRSTQPQSSIMQPCWCRATCCTQLSDGRVRYRQHGRTSRPWQNSPWYVLDISLSDKRRHRLHLPLTTHSGLAS